MNSLRRCQPLCGTFFEIEASSLNLSDDQLLEASQVAFQKADRLEKIFSPFDTKSELSRFNNAKIEIGFSASDLFYEALKRTKFLYDETEGLFTPYKTKQALSFELQSNNKIKKTDSASLNINGFIKGWIVDIMVETLQRLGVDKILVNGGGDLRYWFNPQISTQIEHPPVIIRDFEDPNRSKTLKFNDSYAIATSANYAYDFEHPKDHQIRFVEKEAHSAFFFSATVVAEECWKADALTKVLVQNHKQAETCAKRWNVKLYFKSREKELCFEPSKT